MQGAESTLSAIFYSAAYMQFLGLAECAKTMQRLPVFWKQKFKLFYPGTIAFVLPSLPRLLVHPGAARQRAAALRTCSTRLSACAQPQLNTVRRRAPAAQYRQHALLRVRTPWTSWLTRSCSVTHRYAPIVHNRCVAKRAR
jgi:hypothetical protein